jgi:TolB-like protein
MKRFLFAVSLAVLPGLSRAGQPLADMASRVGAAARRARVARVAVLPFSSRAAGGGHDGEVLADMLTERLVADGRVRVVERTRLPEVMAERRLSAVGATISSGGGSPALAAADAVVTGAFVFSGGKMRVSVRLVHAETGEILAAAEESFDWDAPAGEPRDDGAWTMTIPAPEFLAEVPPIVMDPVELRDAPNDDSCADAAARVDRIAAGVLEVKARYWAYELRRGFSPYAVTRNPGSEISDPALKERFYAEMKSWFKKPFVPELSRSEFERMRREDARASEISSRCGL